MLKMPMNRLMALELEMESVFRVGSSFAHTRTNKILSPVNQGEPEETSRFRLQIL